MFMQYVQHKSLLCLVEFLCQSLSSGMYISNVQIITACFLELEHLNLFNWYMKLLFFNKCCYAMIIFYFKIHLGLRKFGYPITISNSRFRFK